MFLNFCLYELTSGRCICSAMTLNQHGPTCTLSTKSTQQQHTKTSSHCWFKPGLCRECMLTHTHVGGWTKCVLHPEWIMNLQWIIHIPPRCIKCVLLQAVLNNENVCINIYTFLLCTSTTAELKEKQQLKRVREEEYACRSTCTVLGLYEYRVEGNYAHTFLYLSVLEWWIDSFYSQMLVNFANIGNPII